MGNKQEWFLKLNRLVMKEKGEKNKIKLKKETLVASKGRKPETKERKNGWFDEWMKLMDK